MKAAHWRAASIACALLVIACSDASAGEQLLISAIDPPNVLATEVHVDGVPLEKRWDDYFAKLFSFLDRNADGRFDRTEASRAPAPALVLNHLRGDFDDVPVETVSWQQLQGQRPVDHVDIAALAGYYRRHGVGRIELKLLTPQDDPADRVTIAILAALGDRRGLSLTSIGIGRAEKLLRQLDIDDDQRLSIAEFLMQPAATAVDAPVRPVDQPLATLALSAGHASPGLIVRLASDDAAAQTLEAHGPLFGKARPVQRDLIQSPIGTLIVDRKGATLSLAVTPSTAIANFTAARESLAQDFETADQDTSGSLDDREAGESLTPVRWRVLTKIADANADKRLGHAELDHYLDLQASAAAQQVVVTVADRGPALLAAIDRDHDGRLSLREMIETWTTADPTGKPTRMAAWDVNRDGRITRDELPRRLEVTFSIGSPGRLSAPSTDTHAPAPRTSGWFQALDANGDGDLSPREFIGRREDFDTFDRDGNGLIDAAEAGTAP